MPKSEKSRSKKTGGPYLAAAIFCDNVLRGEDGAMSAIRIIDHLTVTIPADAPADVPSESKRVATAVWALVMFKSGGSPGRHEVSLVVQSPSGKRHNGPKHEMTFSPEPHGGANLRINLGLGIKEGGIFLIDVLLDGKRVTRMPLLITVTRDEAAPAPAIQQSATKTAKAAKSKPRSR